jgi:methylamine dehydrogenase accessory protein MauD
VDGWWAVSYVVLWLVVVTLSVIVIALARQIGALHLRLGPRGALELDDEGPELGAEVARADVADTAGRALTIAARGEVQFLLFVSPSCPLCDQIMPSVGALAREEPLRSYVLVDADPEEAAAIVRRRRIDAPVVPASEIARDYDIPGTPYAVVLDGEGRVTAKGTVNTLEQMEGLVDTALRRLGGSVGELTAA